MAEVGEGDASGLKWVTLFDNMGDKGKDGKALDAVNPTTENAKPTGDKTKKLSVERIYQKKSQLEHILLRPDTYIGSVQKLSQLMWVVDDETGLMVQKDITFVPGLFKIFDEILVNAADNKQRDPNMTCIKVDIDPENGKIKIWNNGRGIPVVEHKTENMFVPTLIFGHLLTSSNYDDSEKKVTGGRNGYGAKLCNIFSHKFVVETSSHEYRKAFKQTWTNNMTKTKEPTITSAIGDDYTSVTFYPDLSKFSMETLDDDCVAVFKRRAYDIAASAKGVKVFLNGKKLQLKNFRDYVDLYIKDKVDEAGQPLKVIHEVVNSRWEVAVTISDKGFQQASFVNSIATTKGGRHVDYITEQVVTKLIDIVKKKNKGSINIKPFQIKSHIWVFVNCLIENPTFDSQTKENMTLLVKSFGSRCQLSDKFITQASKCGIVESVVSWMKFKEQAQLNKKCSGSKHSKLKGIPKLDDANDAGTKNSIYCTLILTEGDSAKSLAVAGLGIVGRDRFGVFPLRGKLLNVREATHKQIMENAEINNVIKIMGLHFKEKYEDSNSLRSLRYGKIMIMTDQDQDGSHIKGLLINFIHHFWPNLLKHNVVEEFITPIIKVTKGKEEKSFYSIPEFEEWQKETYNWHTWKIKYYKGLGTSTSKEAKEYFADMERHRIPFRYMGPEDDASINLAFSKKKIEERKEWLSTWMEERKRREEMGLPELYLYKKGTKNVSFNDFINRELILFSNMDNVRSIPSLLDGLKPGQRKVIFTCLKRNDKKEVKVAQLAGSVAELSSYHHGEVSLMSTIINLAQNFVGSNNINLLIPQGQFGTRLHGGKDAASPRYIFTLLSPVSKLIFNTNDLPLLKQLTDDNQKIEPEWYIPIIPTVLVNGTDGIGTGWSTRIFNHNPREIIANIKRMLDGLEPFPMKPWFKNFKGTIEDLSDNRYVVSGEVAEIDESTIEITELPVRVWTQNYKEEVLEPMLHGSEKTASMILDYKEYHTDSTVKFIVKMSPEKLSAAKLTGLHRVFKLQTTLTSFSMVLFDENGCIKKYDKIDDILKEFFNVRLKYYEKRKQYLLGMLSAESLKLDNVARFIMEKIDGLIRIENVKKKDIIQLLVRRGYDSDPLKAWKESQKKDKEDTDEEEEEAEDDDNQGQDFNYLLGLSLWSLTQEKKDELLDQKRKKAEELAVIQQKTPKCLWLQDIDEFIAELDRVEQLERDDEKPNLSTTQKSVKGRIKSKKVALEETLPSQNALRVVPHIDIALKQKAEKDAAKKQREKSKKLKVEPIEEVEGEDSEPKSLAERLNFEGDILKQTTNARSVKRRIRQPSGSPKGKKRSGKKKKPWSDSEDELDLDDDDDDMSNFVTLPSTRERMPRRATAEKVKYNFDDDEDEMAPSAFVTEFSEDGDNDDDDDDDDAGENLFTNNKISNLPDADTDDLKNNIVVNQEDDFSSQLVARAEPVPVNSVNDVASKTADGDPKKQPKKRAMKKAPAVKLDPKQPTITDSLNLIRKKPKPVKISSDEEAATNTVKTVKDKIPKKRGRQKKKSDLSDNSDVSDSEMIPKKKTNRTKRAKSSDASDDGFIPTKKMKAVKSKNSVNDENAAVEETGFSARTTTGRSRAPVKYFDSDDDDFDF